LLGIFYLLIILPQQRQAKKHKEMTNALKNGDKVVTSGGVLGEVVKADENDEFIKVEINKGVTIRIERSAIARKVDEDKAAASGGFFAAETK
jgi:preprotein translocase subunit YajC